MRDRERSAGGGDLSRGETGQCGVLSPELDPEVDLEGLGTREASWFDEAAGGSWGMFADERARWMAAAEGTVVLGPARPGPRLGLASLLLLREGRADLDWVSASCVLRCEWRAGDELREDMGELVADRGPDTSSERAALLVWLRMGAGTPSEGVAVGAWFAAAAGAVGVGVVEVGVVLVDADVDVDADAGSAVSGEPVRERKEPSVMLAWGWLVLACRSLLVDVKRGCTSRPDGVKQSWVVLCCARSEPSRMAVKCQIAAAEPAHAHDAARRRWLSTVPREIRRRGPRRAFAGGGGRWAVGGEGDGEGQGENQG